MAGAGYKLFATGDVLTAAQVNTYLQEQTVMVFADAAARTTALSGVLAEGMCSYLKSTKVVEIYNGTAWASLDDPNAIQNTIVDAKGDLITATGNDVPARLAVGNNGETLVADSAATTGLRWQSNFAAGKNKIINGDFSINQRNLTSTTAGGYGFDRWSCGFSGGTVTYSAQTFTPGAAPVSGYEGTNFARVVTASQSAAGNYAALVQNIENVRTLAGQTVTVSFWAKAASGTPKVFVELAQQFGSGGTPSSDVLVPAGSVTLSTSWARHSVTVAMPSISGKTIGTNTNSSYIILNLWISAGSTFDSRTSSLGIQNNTFDFWGVQLEAGNVATAFQTATGTLAGELAACQRYYYRATGETYSTHGWLNAYSTTNGIAMTNLPVTMRVAPTSVDYANLRLTNYGVASFTVTSVALLSGQTAKNVAVYEGVVASGLTANRMYGLENNNNTAGYIGFSAEL